MTSRPIPPHGLGWALFALALGGIGIGTGEFVPMGLLPDIAASIGEPVTTSGHVISAYAIGVVVGAPAFAILGAKAPRRSLLIGLMAVYALGNLGSAMASSYDQLLAARFLTGLPHGAFFGVASLAAAAMVEPSKRAWAIARVMLGLSVANVLFVPAATAMGNALGWRSVFIAVAVVAVLTILAMIRFVPHTESEVGASMRGELGALKRPQVLLTLGIGAIGFGGMFAVYSYITPTLTERTGVADSIVPLYLVVVGLGMVTGTLLGGHLIDRALRRTMFYGLIAFGVTLAIFSFASVNPYTAALALFLLGNVLLLGPALQTRLMDVAGDAQTLAATMNHASFNTANAIGPLLAGMAVASTGSWATPSWVGVGLVLGGLAFLLASLWLERRTNERAGLEAFPGPAHAGAPRAADAADGGRGAGGASGNAAGRSGAAVGLHSASWDPDGAVVEAVDRRDQQTARV